MNSSQASVPTGGARLVAVRLAGAAALSAIDRAWTNGEAVLPLDPALPASRARAIATDLGAEVLIDRASDNGPDTSAEPTADDHLVRPLPDPAPVPDGTALVVRTSGSTGVARGVVLSHDALQAGVRASLLRLGCTPIDRWLCVLPLHHVAGLLVVLRARALGSEPLIHVGFDPAGVLGERDATHVALVPTMLRRLLACGADGTRTPHVLLGGAAAPSDMLERARAAGIAVTTTYGMTETSGGCVYDGVPLEGAAAAVEPDGRVLLAGPMLATGYRDGHALTPLTDDGWLRTNDVGRWQHGQLVVTGRADDVIVTGGVNVSATAVATALRAHPAVVDAAVIGVDDPEWGQRVVALVTPTDPAHPPLVGQLRAHVRHLLEQAAAPREVVVVDALPRTSLGKVDRPALARLRAATW